MLCITKHMRGLRVFVLFVALGGLGGFLGSIAGASFGRAGLFAGGIAGGLLLTPLSAWLAVRLGWIPAASRSGATIGAAVGFLGAVAVAVNTLSSPIGPLLSPLLVGAGALAGIRWSTGGRRGSR